MKTLFWNLIDLWISLFFKPGTFAQVSARIGVIDRKVSVILSALSALSVAVGVVLLDPPYSSFFWAPLMLSWIANFLLLLVFPELFAGFMTLYLCQKRREMDPFELLTAVRYSIPVFLLYSPIAILCTEFRVPPFLGYIVIGFLLLTIFMVVVSRVVEYSYDIKRKEARRLGIRGIFALAMFPILFYLFASSYIVNLIL